MDFSFFSFLDSDYQRLVGCFGLENGRLPIQHSICAHVLGFDQITPLIVPDLRADPRFSDNPLVSGEPGLGFYAGFPVFVEGEAVGLFCVAHGNARDGLDEGQRRLMDRLAHVAGALLTAKEAEIRAAEATFNLVRSQHRHDLALRTARIATFTWNRESGAIEADDLFRQMLALGGSLPLTVEDVAALVLPTHREGLFEEIERELAERKEFSVEMPLSIGGRSLGVTGRILDPVDDAASGHLVYGVAIDLTERRLAEQKRRHLLKELNHRVRNTLAMLQSLAGQTLRRSHNAEEFNVAFHGRLQALSSAHHLLTDHGWEAVDVHELLSQQMRAVARGKEEARRPFRPLCRNRCRGGRRPFPGDP